MSNIDPVRVLKLMTTGDAWVDKILMDMRFLDVGDPQAAGLFTKAEFIRDFVLALGPNEQAALAAVLLRGKISQALRPNGG